NVIQEFNSVQKQIRALKELSEGNQRLAQGNDAYFNRVVVDLKKELHDKITESSVNACLLTVDAIKEIKNKYEGVLLTIDVINKRAAETEKRSKLIEQKLGEVVYGKVK